MKHSASRHLYLYWNNVRRLRAAPDRAEIDPAAIRALLPDTFMLEVDERHSFPFRLSGARLNAWFGRNLKASSFLDLWSEERANMAAVLWTVMDGTTPVVAGVRARSEGRLPIDLELLLLPLRHQGKTHSRILGLLGCPRPPDWHGLLPIKSLELSSLRVLTADRSQVDLPVLGKSGDGLSGAELGGAGLGYVQHAHLRVYHGGLESRR